MAEADDIKVEGLGGKRCVDWGARGVTDLSSETTDSSSVLTAVPSPRAECDDKLLVPRNRQRRRIQLLGKSKM